MVVRNQSKSFHDQRLGYKYRIQHKRVRPAVKRTFLKMAKEMFLDHISKDIPFRKYE
ncbi:hypothetical protein [Thermoactinomyces mirandus]|uniref:Uncharacterized protein n=1 Tax=Thermoactinomyces mirandus TaxID=2756294 RepID=A0A7W1XRX2_9BACL|nr:hypothetical protein [Thermoactinomyces mirandus]MBA4602159.1 hypothetical protein [Thermoactinomyces mirandus]